MHLANKRRAWVGEKKRPETHGHTERSPWVLLWGWSTLWFCRNIATFSPNPLRSWHLNPSPPVLCDLQTWLSSNFLRVNSDKNWAHGLLTTASDLVLTICPAPSLCNRSVTLESIFYLFLWTANTLFFFHLHTCPNCHSLLDFVAETLMHAFIFSHLDCCNEALSGISTPVNSKLHCQASHPGNTSLSHSSVCMTYSIPDPPSHPQVPSCPGPSVSLRTPLPL